MKPIITLIGFISCLNVAAQSKYFEKSFGWTNVQQGHKVAYINDTTYLIVGRQLSATDNLARSFGLLINQYGVEIQLDVYPSNDDEQQYAADMVTTKTGFAIGSCLEHIENQCTSSLILLNQEGIYQKIEILGNMDFNNGARTILKGENDNLLLGGHIIKSTFWETYLIKTDSEGNKLWEKTYSLNTSHSHTIRDILPAEEGGYYLLIVTNLNFNTNPESGDIMIMKIDEEGEEEWQKIYNLGEVDQAWRLVSTIDGGFVLGGVVGSGNAAIIKLDVNFEVEWIKEGVFPYCGINTLQQLEDGNYMAVGCYETESGETGNDVKLVKLDENGEVLWERTYGGDRHDYAYDMIHLEDGSFLISGRIESIPNPSGANVYLIKTNCMGLLTEPQTSFSAEQDSEQTLTYHFTNHSQYIYPDSIDGGHFLWDFGDGTTSDELHPSHTFAEKGDSYIVTLTAVVCSDTSVMDIKVVAGEEIVSIDEIEGLPAFSFKLYPNPVSDGQLRVEYDLPKEGRLELYDLQGKEMGNCQLLMVNAEVELGLEELDSGMYLYRLVSEGRTLKGGKLVVED